MRKAETAFLQHALDACQRIAQFAPDYRADELRADPKAARAVLFEIVVIGEALGRIGPEMRSRLPALPWREAIGMRNRLVHAYDEIDYDRVAFAIAVSIPRLALQLAQAIAQEGDGP